MELATAAEAAKGPDRALDRSIAFELGIGTPRERILYERIGQEMWVLDDKGLSTFDKACGDRTRLEWMKGAKGKLGYYKTIISRAEHGPRPLTDCPFYTASLDAATTLVPKGRWFGIGNGSPSERPWAWCQAPGVIGDQGICHAVTPALALTVSALRAHAEIAAAQGAEASAIPTTA